jgi:DMSO/TMAO reductase YedYZ molybdopterin-dependent catalytic subunit
MRPISRGVSWSPASHQRRSRVPPGQYVTRGLPVLSAGPTPHTPLAEWSFTIHGAVAEPMSWSWGSSQRCHRRR